jgi:sn-glycerol 3-phosphate transport system substrate-binding protein
MKKSIFILFTFIFMILAACSNQSDEATATPSENKDGKTEVIFWHAMSGDLETVLKEIVEEFNQSHPSIEVKPIFQGTYEEALTKFNTVAGTKDAPTIMQTFEVGTKYMIDSGKIQPVQKFIDEENYDISQWEKIS